MSAFKRVLLDRNFFTPTPPAGSYVKGAPIYGTYGGSYDDDGDGGSTWVADGPGYWNQDDDGTNYWVGDSTNTIIGYEPDVFVPDTTPDTTPDTDTTTGTTDTTTDPVVYTPPPIELGLDIPGVPTTDPDPTDPLGLNIPYVPPVGNDPYVPPVVDNPYMPPVGPPGNLGLGIPAAPTYYEEFVPPQQPVVPQQTQAELLQQIVNQGQAAQAFQDGGLATPVQEPMPMVGAGIASLQNRIQKQQVRSPLSSGIGGQGAVLGSFR